MKCTLVGVGKGMTCTGTLGGVYGHVWAFFPACRLRARVLRYRMPVLSLKMHIIRQSGTQWRGVWKGGTEYVNGADYLDVYYKLLSQRTAKL